MTSRRGEWGQSAPAQRRGPPLPLVAGAVVVLLAIAVLLLFVVLLNRPAAHIVAASPTPSVAPSVAELPPERLTVLIIGTDANAARGRDAQANTDSLMVASINAARTRVSVVSLPRDTVDIPLPNGQTWTGKVNALMSERGVVALRGALETLFGIEIHHHVAIDMDDFVTLVDAVGGVEVEVAAPLADPPLRFSLPAGDHLLAGDEALSYVRTRVDGDHARAARQQEVLLELVGRFGDPDADIPLAVLFNELESLDTDLPQDQMPTLFEIAEASRDARVTRQVLMPPRFALFEGIQGARGWVMIPNVPEMRDFVQGLMGDDAS